jgi:tRNA dimethylallyltransferase
MPDPTVVFVMGPTASGKTNLAVKLVAEFPFEIISVDSAMVYRGMDIGTAKPDEDTLRRAPHRLIDICDPIDPYSAAQFAQDAQQHMAEISSQGRIPLLVGGTFLYFKALYNGLSPLPAADVQVRAELERQAGLHGWQYMHQKLASIDPEAAQRIHPNDPQRIQRALEVYEIAGESMTTILKRDHNRCFPYSVLKILLVPSDRVILHRRIEQRFNLMVENGLVDEVSKLRQCEGVTKNLPSMRAVGYRQVWEYLDGEVGHPEMIKKGVAATRQFAKRQLTWLRSEREGECFDAIDKNVYDKILKKLLNSPICNTEL